MTRNPRKGLITHWCSYTIFGSIEDIYSGQDASPDDDEDDEDWLDDDAYSV